MIRFLTFAAAALSLAGAPHAQAAEFASYTAHYDGQVSGTNKFKEASLDVTSIETCHTWEYRASALLVSMPIGSREVRAVLTISSSEDKDGGQLQSHTKLITDVIGSGSSNRSVRPHTATLSQPASGSGLPRKLLPVEASKATIDAAQSGKRELRYSTVDENGNTMNVITYIEGAVAPVGASVSPLLQRPGWNVRLWETVNNETFRAREVILDNGVMKEMTIPIDGLVIHFKLTDITSQPRAACS